MNIFVIYGQNFRFSLKVLQKTASLTMSQSEDQLMETEDEDSGYDSMCEDEEDSKEDDDIRPCAPLILMFPPEDPV